MAYIISPSDQPRREDVAARRIIDANRPTIERLADQISNGAYSARKAARAAPPATPEASGLFIPAGAGAAPSEPRPYVRVSPNKRVVLVDFETGRQLAHLGEVRRVDGRWRFVLATRANGFFQPVADETALTLAPLDGAAMGGARGDDALAAEITELLGLAPL